ncbi:MAG: hypothetical protein WC061_09085, partial [Melioribacteraceae bacterium]
VIFLLFLYSWQIKAQEVLLTGAIVIQNEEVQSYRILYTLAKDKSLKQKPVFKRVFAPGFSHTIRKEVRSCTACHNNSLAIGYGRGKLEYKISGSEGIWKFTPAYRTLKYDGLPEDAWIGFLNERSYNSTTRDNTRPFSVHEQKKILTVGACLTCHTSESWIMRNSLIDFQITLAKKSEKCILPLWN